MSVTQPFDFAELDSLVTDLRAAPPDSMPDMIPMSTTRYASWSRFIDAARFGADWFAAEERGTR